MRKIPQKSTLPLLKLCRIDPQLPKLPQKEKLSELCFQRVYLQSVKEIPSTNAKTNFLNHQRLSYLFNSAADSASAMKWNRPIPAFKDAARSISKKGGAGSQRNLLIVTSKFVATAAKFAWHPFNNPKNSNMKNCKSRCLNFDEISNSRFFPMLFCNGVGRLWQLCFATTSGGKRRYYLWRPPPIKQTFKFNGSKFKFPLFFPRKKVTMGCCIY